MRIANIIVGLIPLVILSCNKNETIIDDGAGVNVPNVASTQNAFGYYVTAQSFTFVQTVPLTFTCDSLSYALSISGYSYGTASILIYADSLRYRSSDLVFNTNQAFMFSLMRCKPDSITLTFSRFSGRVSFALSGVASSLPKATAGKSTRSMLRSHRQ